MSTPTRELPAQERNRARRAVHWQAALLLFLLILVILITAVFIPTGWVLISPGTVVPLLPVTTVAGSLSPPGEEPAGEVLLLTVSARPANIYNLAAWAAGMLPQSAAIRAADMIPTGMSDAEYLAYSAEQMRESIGIAATVAHHGLGLPASATGGGARVVSVGARPDRTVNGLRVGDTVLAAGSPVAMTGDLAAILGRRQPGDTVLLEVLRSDRLVTITSRVYATAAGTEESMLGVTLATVDARFSMAHEVSIDVQGVAGPSGGLALALAAYQKLADHDLLAGRVVAATGYIRADAEGSIGPVGGVAFKALAAERAGATVMLVHPTNLAEAKSAGTGLEIVPVASFAAAVAYLRDSGLTTPK